MYAAPDGIPGFSLCMLEGVGMMGHYRDAFLHAVAAEAGATGDVIGGIESNVNGLVESDDDYLLQVPQVSVDDELVDTLDRVQMCANFLRELVDVGP